MIPVALSLPAAAADNIAAPVPVTSGNPSEMFEQGNDGNAGRSVRMEKFCDQIVIHVANTDKKGTDEIREEVIKVFNEIYEV